MSAPRIITFTTDFGTQDHYVGTMKGVVLSICPGSTLVDICHEVPSYDVLEGAITISQAYAHFPASTVHIIVVDPGVGSARRPIVAETGNYVFVCPDNGVLSLVYHREQHVTVRHITNDRYFRHPVSSTFHGRDIFAPVAAHIAAGVPVEDFGPAVEDFARLDLQKPVSYSRGRLQGAVIKIDKFGNIVTNVTASDLAGAVGAGTGFRVRIANTSISDFRASYAGAPSGQLFAIFGSMGYLEIAGNQMSAADRLKVTAGTPVEISAR